MREIIKGIKCGGVPGEDGIRSGLLKNEQDEILDPLLSLADLCFEAGDFPNMFKVGAIKPLLKSGHKSNLSNYRSICLTSNLSKIIEKLLKIRTVGFLEKKGIHTTYKLMESCLSNRNQFVNKNLLGMVYRKGQYWEPLYFCKQLTIDEKKERLSVLQMILWYCTKKVRGQIWNRRKILVEENVGLTRINWRSIYEKRNTSTYEQFKYWQRIISYGGSVRRIPGSYNWWSSEVE